MRVRAIDAVTGDWTFGKGRNNYVDKNLEIGQSLRTRILSFLGDCFFDQQAGIDWFNLLGYNSRVELELAIAATILNTEGVVRIRQLSTNLNDRALTVSYSIFTVYSQTIANEIQLDAGLVA